jgi:HSP20 family protein
MFTLNYTPMFALHNRCNQLASQLDELFEPCDRRAVVNPIAFPLLNAWEDEHCFYLEAELPGFTLNDLEIFMTAESTVTIRGERKEPELSGGKWQRRERAFGCFERTLTLPGPVSADQVEATLKHGILMVKLPQAVELRPRKIEIKTA